MTRALLALTVLLFLVSCRPDTYTPKPRGYYLVDLPKHEYQEFNDPRYPYSFQYPVYGKIIPDTNFFGEKPENPYWINIDFPSLGGKVYISYKTINASQTLEKLGRLDDAREFYRRGIAATRDPHALGELEAAPSILGD